MISFPNAKINLGLNVVSKREDGYHNIESCFCPVGWSDILEIIPADELQFSSSGIDIPGDPNENLCIKAYSLISMRYQISPVNIHLHKNIPIGAGLGGGSSDGAFALKMLSDLFSLNISVEELEEMASEMGSDCPFFIDNKARLVSGTGNIFENIDLDILDQWIVLIYPELHISTGEAYQSLIPKKPEKYIANILNDGYEVWKSELNNDFESNLVNKYPIIQSLKNKLYDCGASYASMSGSGSTVFGIFENERKPDILNNLPVGFKYWQGKLSV